MLLPAPVWSPSAVRRLFEKVFLRDFVESFFGVVPFDPKSLYALKEAAPLRDRYGTVSVERLFL